MRPITVIAIDNSALETARQVAGSIAQVLDFAVDEIEEGQTSLLNEWVESHDTALVVIGVDASSKIQRYLDITRELRVPYLFVKPGQTFTCRHIALPVTRFMEEREKGPYCGSFARNFGSKITIYKPKDYGSAAQQNIESIAGLLSSMGLEYDVVKGGKDSSGIEMEAVMGGCDMCIIGASRDYGLDDIIFGPKERKIIKMAKVPVMVVNPRGDLYPLCD